VIIITGCGRSGTSAVARLVHESGLSVGHELIEADESNAEGYYEERPLIQFNQAVINDLGLGEAFATATREEIIAAAEARMQAMQEVLAAATPAWKDPRFCWLLEAWVRVLPERPRVIVCLRNPAEVVASTQRYFGQVDEESARAVEHTWRCEYERLLEVLDEYRLDAISIEFDDLHRHPAEAIKPLGRFLDRPLDASLVRSDLRHHATALAPEFAAMYEAVRRLGHPSPAGDPAARAR
jgi:hypothetical protein